MKKTTTRARRRPAVIWQLALCALLSFCTSGGKKDDARKEFSRTHTCPLDRVEIRARADVRASVALGRLPREAAADIKNDPGRLAMWEKEERASMKRTDDQYDCYDLRGCGTAELDCCTYADVGGIMCSTGTDPAQRSAPKSAQ